MLLSITIDFIYCRISSLGHARFNVELCFYSLVLHWRLLTCAVPSIPRVPSFAEATVRTWLVHTTSTRVTVVSSNPTLIDVSAFPSITFISIQALASECTDAVRTGCIDTTIVCLHFALVNVSARSSITRKSFTASTIIWTEIVCAKCF